MNFNINNVNGKMASSNSNPSPIAFNIGKGVLGSYDNLNLRTSCSDSWKKPPCNPPLKSNKLFLPQGTPLPLKNEMIFSDLPRDSMFMFSQNYSSPSCSSNYSTDRGAVCTTPSQRRYVGQNRGLNKTYGNYSF
tara:strand:- start:17 stop:418 length:402 start_codon:yes stop_codon:yes gene_type:complete